MVPADEAKIQKLLDLLEDQRIICLKAIATCEALEKEFRIRLNEDWSLNDPNKAQV